MEHDFYQLDYIRGILKSVQRIAIAGASDNPAKPSFLVQKYLAERGYEIFPVNPGKAGQKFHGREVFARLADVPKPIDMVDIFRASAFAGGLVDEALNLDPLPKVIWMQLSVRDDAAAARAEAMGVQVVMNRCPKIEYGRISGEISWNGVNSRILSSKKPVLSVGGFQKLRLDG